MGMISIRQMSRFSTLMFADYFMSCNEAMTRLFVLHDSVTYEVKRFRDCSVGTPYIIRFLSNNPSWSDWATFVYHIKTDCTCFLSIV